MAVPKGTPPPNKGVPMSAEQYAKCYPTMFKPGHVPASKGKKMSAEQYAKCAPTMFKPGRPSTNIRPVGSERVNVYGYVEIKVADPNKWKLKQRVVWEAANGPIPPGQKLYFIDGNKQNCTLENLMLLSNSDQAVINRRNLACHTREGMEAAVKIAQLIRASKKRRTGRKRNE